MYQLFSRTWIFPHVLFAELQYSKNSENATRLEKSWTAKLVAFVTHNRKFIKILMLIIIFRVEIVIHSSKITHLTTFLTTWIKSKQVSLPYAIEPHIVRMAEFASKPKNRITTLYLYVCSRFLFPQNLSSSCFRQQTTW